MNLFKRKYQYIQHFLKGSSAGDKSFLGFYRMGTEDGHQAFFESDFEGALFPHYGFSFYENPPGRIVMKGKGNTPSVFKSDRLNSLGLGSLIKRVKSTDMFTDHGLASYRPLSFAMALGTADNLKRDLGFLREASLPLGKDKLWQDLNALDWIETVSKKDQETLSDHRKLFDEVFHLDITGDTGYLDVIYLMADTMTSVVLSHTTVQNIIRTQARHLKPLFQIPLCPDADESYLSGLFNMDRTRVKPLTFRGCHYDLFGVFPGLFGFKGAIFDVSTGMVSGKRNHLVQFLLLLNGLNLLSQRDLRYLV